MALKVELKPGERILIGECVITNPANARASSSRVKRYRSCAKRTS